MIIQRRALLRGLFAAPAIVAVDSLMPLRGVPLWFRNSADHEIAMLENAIRDALGRFLFEHITGDKLRMVDAIQEEVWGRRFVLLDEDNVAENLRLGKIMLRESVP